MRYSVIIPVYNRPDEVDELLQSLTAQHFKDFEVVVVEDGSSVPCEKIVNQYQGKLDIYITTTNRTPVPDKPVITVPNVATANISSYWIRTVSCPKDISMQ